MKINFKAFLNRACYWRDFILDLIFPIQCLGCGKEGEWLCTPCFQKLEFKKSQYCLGCKKKNNLGEFCLNCRKNYFLDGILIAGSYDNSELLSKLIKSFKYKFVKDIGVDLGKFLAMFLKNLHNKASAFGWNENRFMNLENLEENIIIPVPLHKRRQRWRGFNQAEVLAERLLGKKLEKQPGQLIRIKHGIAQAKLNEGARMKNVKNCFGWRGGDLAGRRVILIDDIVTTGATLNECARILKDAGAEKVWALVAAKG
jgi:ComF family protein